MSSNTIRHIAFIPDGNRRWAEKKHLPKMIGHKAGFDLIQKLYDQCLELGIEYATFFLFSTENWKRTQEEVSYLFNLFRDMFETTLKRAQEKKIRIKYIGDIERLPEDVSQSLRELVEKTKNNEALTVVVALSYSGRDEIVRATQKIVNQILSKKNFDNEFDEKKFCEDLENLNKLNEETFEKYLDTCDIPPPDILIRTGERRISNFLLWQIAYSEIFFVDKLWPDFNREDLQNILDEYAHRKRKYGK